MKYWQTNFLSNSVFTFSSHYIQHSFEKRAYHLFFRYSCF